MKRMKSPYNIILFYLLLQGVKGNSLNIKPSSWVDVIMASNHHDNFCFNHLREQIDIIDGMKEKINNLEKELEIREVRSEERDTQLKAKDDLLIGKEEQIVNLKSQIDTSSAKLMKCKQEEENLSNSGIYGIQRIQVAGQSSIDVSYVLPPSGWTVIQRRLDGSVNFDRDWDEYEKGFGDKQGEFFIGLEKLYSMTNDKPHELYIQLRDINGNSRYARYDNFKVDSEDENYKLISVGAYTGTAGDALSAQVDYMFTTFDEDNDDSDFNCANNRWGGWWYSGCGYTHLNGKYHKSGISTDFDGVSWVHPKSWNHPVSLTFSQMMIRPIIQ